MAVDRENLQIPEEVRTERLILRSARAGDQSALHAAIDDSLTELFPWLSFSAKLPSIEILEQVCLEGHDKFLEQEFFVWRVWDRNLSTMVGTVDLHSIDWDVPSCEIGYWMRTSHTRKGLGQEAVQAIIDVAHQHLKALRIEARCDTRNERSYHLVERLGFQYEGTAHNDDRDASGELCSTRVYALTRNEW